MMRRRRCSMPELHGVLIAKTPDEQAMFALVNALAGLPKLPLGQGEE